MDYTVDQKALSAPFFMPAEIADKHLKLATRDQLRVIIYIFRNTAEHPEAAQISQTLGIALNEVNDAIEYWANAGILVCENKNPEVLKKRTKARMQSEKLTHWQVAEMADEKLAFLFNEIQVKLARLLRPNEQSTFAWLYTEEGMDISVILMLVEYAKGLDKANIRFIEKTAIEWLDAGVENIASAEEYILRSAKEEMCCKMLAAAFGIRDRKLNKTEKNLAVLWIEEQGFKREMLEAAYDICIDSIGSYNIKYIKGIFEQWKKSGIKTPEDIEKEAVQIKEKTWESKKQKSGAKYSAIDKDLLAKLLDND